MPIHVYRPVTKGRRQSSVQDFSDLTAHKPQKSLLRTRVQRAGRSGGKIAVRHQGSGHKRQLREIDFQRERFDIPAKISTIEYDPSRGARIALLVYRDGHKSYTLCPDRVKVGDIILSSKNEIDIAVGNRMPLHRIPIGTPIHAVELMPGQGAALGRAAGTRIEFMALEGERATLRLPSGEIRYASKDCLATIGTVSNPDWHLVRWGKAGRMRNRGIRPTVRGKVMNPVDHPHGGGEGKHPIGMKYAKTKWGKHALGVKTRRTKLPSDRSILFRRNGRKLAS